MDISDSEFMKMLEEQDYERLKNIMVDLSIKPQIPKKEDYSHLTMDGIVDNLVNKVASIDFLDYIEEKCERENVSFDRFVSLVQEGHTSKFKEFCEQSSHVHEEMRKKVFANTQPQNLLDTLFNDCESAMDQKDCFATSKCEQTTLQNTKKFDVNADPKKLWNTLFDEHKSAIDQKDYFKAANTCRLIQNQIDFQVSKKELSTPAACLLKQNLLSRYASIVDDVSEGGINNYFKEIQIENNTSKPQCDKWVSALDKLSEEELLTYMDKDFIGPPEKESAKVDESLLEDEVKKLVCEKMNATLANCPAHILEKAFGADINLFPKKDSPKASTSETVKLNYASVPVFAESKRKAFIDETRNSYLSSNMSNSNGRSNEKEKIAVKRKQRDISYLSKPKIKEQPAEPIPSFKSAKDMFGLQKKDKSSTNARKCLGSKRGLSSKYVSPIFQQEDDDERPQKETKVIHDEQLKGIDPKMIEVMMNEIMYQGSPTSWDDIAGLKFVKATLQEIVVWPLLRPDLFTGLRGPPKGILLFGPPGTGKTLIGKCVASQSKSTFFSISASSLGSKWYGEGEKLVRALFTVARCHQPAVIFIDEIDSLLTQRSDNDHESSRRVKTEFLVQLDGVKTVGEERLLIIGATNRPQELDEAARRRLVKRLYIPLPEACARIQIVKTLLTSHHHELSEDDLNVLKTKTEGYSGADMANLCKEAALGPIRSIGLENIATIDSDNVRPIKMIDFLKALNQVRASVSDADLALYEDWNKKYGSIFSET